MMATWRFYGRRQPLVELQRILDGARWFFCRIQGRRRIGKTTLLTQLAQDNPSVAARLVYMQVPDSDERDVVAVFRRSLEESELPLAPHADGRGEPVSRHGPGDWPAVPGRCAGGAR